MIILCLTTLVWQILCEKPDLRIYACATKQKLQSRWYLLRAICLWLHSVLPTLHLTASMQYLKKVVQSHQMIQSNCDFICFPKRYSGLLLRSLLWWMLGGVLWCEDPMTPWWNVNLLWDTGYCLSDSTCWLSQHHLQAPACKFLWLVL